MQLQLHKIKLANWVLKKLKFPLSFCELLFISKMFHCDVRPPIPAALTDSINNRDLKRELAICPRLPELSGKRMNKIILNYVVGQHLSPQMWQLWDPPFKFHSAILSVKHTFNDRSYLSVSQSVPHIHGMKICWACDQRTEDQAFSLTVYAHDGGMLLGQRSLKGGMGMTLCLDGFHSVLFTQFCHRGHRHAMVSPLNASA